MYMQTLMDPSVYKSPICRAGCVTQRSINLQFREHEHEHDQSTTGELDGLKH